MITYAELEKIAAVGGYEARGRDISRITAASLHQVYAGLARCTGDEAQQAMIAASRLRRWFVYGDGLPPPVRGAGFLHSNREVWMAYTLQEDPAIVRGRANALAELRSYLAIAITPNYDGSLQARTDPPVHVEASGGNIVLRSKLGLVKLSPPTAQRVEHWLSVTMRPSDSRGVLCLPGWWEQGRTLTRPGRRGSRRNPRA